MTNNRNKLLTLRCAPDELERWRAAAAAAGWRSMAAWVRAVLDDAADRGLNEEAHNG